ncbi:MAG: DNA cytosine methyltransferase, partial [Rubrobacteraceae bacterium]
MRSVELFAGAGGLALGISEAGFEHEAVVEWDRHACHNLRENQKSGT